MKKIILVQLMVGFLFSCTKQENATDGRIPKIVKADAKELMDVNCLTCHQVQENDSNTIAPSLSAVRNVYKKETASRAEFIKAIVNFAKKPAPEKVLLPGAVQKFGVMAVGFPEDKLSKIAAYIYDTEFEKEGFVFNDYKTLSETVAVKDLPYAKRGLKYVLETKKLLGKNLVGALEKKGTDGALSFCNENATGLTKKMATEFGVSIKRVSDKPRNAANAANPSELDYINRRKQGWKKGGKRKPHTFDSGGKIVGYYPIKTKPMCLQCHGEVDKHIKPSTLLSIKALYPEDKAVGYRVGQLRGIWVVEMDKDSPGK